MGMYVNGVEYHAFPNFILFGPSYGDCGFCLLREEDKIMIENVLSGYYELNDRPDAKGNSLFFNLAIVDDSLSLKAGNKYYFGKDVVHGDRFLRSVELRRCFGKNEYAEFFDAFPIALGEFWGYDEKCFFITEGSLTIGEFEEEIYGFGKNLGTIYFEFKAENSMGDTLEIKDGYCKKYHED